MTKASKNGKRPPATLEGGEFKVSPGISNEEKILFLKKIASFAGLEPLESEAFTFGEGGNVYYPIGPVNLFDLIEENLPQLASFVKKQFAQAKEKSLVSAYELVARKQIVKADCYKESSPDNLSSLIFDSKNNIEPITKVTSICKLFFSNGKFSLEEELVYNRGNVVVARRSCAHSSFEIKDSTGELLRFENGVFVGSGEKREDSIVFMEGQEPEEFLPAPYEV